MINLLFSGVALVLLLAAGYWVRGRGGHRPTGTWPMAALLASFALAFASYIPFVESAAESVVPHVGRLLSNSFTLAAATAVLVFMLQLNLEPEEARRSVRLRLLCLGGSVAGMTVLFAAEQMNDRSPQLYALYVLIYITYLGVTAKDFCAQTWKQSHRSRRRSQRIGLRVTAAGCVFALLYAAYKVFTLVSIGLGLGLIPDGARCSTPFTPVRCVFSVTAPALAVLLMALGLTLPAVVWPFSQFLRRRWESRSHAALGPLWEAVTGAAPEVVLAEAEFGEEKKADDFAFFLHRRVIEINDGGLALRPHRSPRVQEHAERAVAELGIAGSPEGDATVEAAVLRAAVHAKKAGSAPRTEAAAPAPGAAARAGNLRAETEWLLLVAHAYARSETVRTVAEEPAPSEMESPA
ncbi:MULTISPECIES: MAB_1171c family putative transporter [unclassified Streptomyces]|uniref:MAB_1171c family putative transporter n=1 Tax=unclassified Streptomyces TaxID=2593676 RepID=UPI0037FA3D26